MGFFMLVGLFAFPAAAGTFIGWTPLLILHTLGVWLVGCVAGWVTHELAGPSRRMRDRQMDQVTARTVAAIQERHRQMSPAAAVQVLDAEIVQEVR